MTKFTYRGGCSVFVGLITIYYYYDLVWTRDVGTVRLYILIGNDTSVREVKDYFTNRNNLLHPSAMYNLLLCLTSITRDGFFFDRKS